MSCFWFWLSGKNLCPHFIMRLVGRFLGGFRGPTKEGLAETKKVIIFGYNFYKNYI